MIHIVDYKTQKIIATLVNKPGAALYWDDWHEKSLKDYTETFDFIMSMDFPEAELVKERNVLIIQDDNDTFREFIIRETNQYSDRKEVFCDASYSELTRQKIIDPITLDEQEVSSLAEYILQGTSWQVGRTVRHGLKSIEWKEHTDALKALRDLAELFDVELLFRLEISGNVITGRYVDFLDRVGSETEKEITLGKDLIGVTRKERSDELITALIGLGPQQENGSRIVVRVQDDAALDRWGRERRHLWDVLSRKSGSSSYSRNIDRAHSG